MEQSVFIIKPDAMKHSRKVKNVLLRAGFRIVSSKKIRLTQKMIDRFYDNLRHKKSIREATMNYLLNKTVEIGIVEGKSAILRLVAVCGQWTNPRKCEPDTLRALLGGKRGKRINRSYIFWRNAIHHSRNKSEAKSLKYFILFNAQAMPVESSLGFIFSILTKKNNLNSSHHSNILKNVRMII